MTQGRLIARLPFYAAIIVFALVVATLSSALAVRLTVPTNPALAASTTATQLAQADPDRADAASFTEETDIIYAVHDGVELKGNLYSPARGQGPFPAVLMVHGGGWRVGSPASFAQLGKFLASNGYVAFSAGYRLAPGEGSEPSLDTSTYPENIWDLKAAVQWMRGEAERLKIDPERIAATGSSAGGHLSAMLGLTGGNETFANPYDDPHAGQPDNIDVTIPMAGIYDMVEQWEQDLQRRAQSPITEWYLGGPFYDGQVRARYYESSPAYHATTQNASDTAWMVVYATEDTIVTPEAQALRFIEDLKRTNATVRLLPVPGETHFSYTSDPGGWDHVSPRILAFLDSQLKN